MNTVYLAGPINGCTDEEASGWRNEITPLLVANGWTVLDPMRRDYRGQEAANVVAIVQGDEADIDASDVFILNATRPTWGSAMELHYASDRDTRCIAIVPDGPVSPWLTYHAELVPSLAACVALLGVSPTHTPDAIRPKGMI